MMSQLTQLPPIWTDRYWSDHGDSFTSEFPGMDTPWLMLALASFLSLFCLYLGPLIMASRKCWDLKPVMLIIDGVAFGTYTCGVLLYLAMINFGIDCFYCDRYYQGDGEGDLRVIGAKYITYILVLTKLYDFNKPIMSTLSKQNERVTKLQMIHLTGALMFTWAGVKLNPGGIFIAVGVTDTLYQALVNGYLVLASAGPEMRTKTLAVRNLLYMFRMSTIGFCFVHSLYFLLIPDCGLMEIKVALVIYSSLLLILYPVDFRRRAKVGNAQRLKQNQNGVNSSNNISNNNHHVKAN